MNTKEFYELPLGINFTANELNDVTIALFVASKYYNEKGLYMLAKDCDEVKEKIKKFTEKNINVHF